VPTTARCWAGRLAKGDFLVNLSVEVASTALVELCQEMGALYIDTASSRGRAATPIPACRLSRRSNYALRDTMLKLVPKFRGGPTAVIAHGANPGPGLALREAGADEPRPRYRREGQGAGQPRRLGAARPPAWASR